MGNTTKYALAEALRSCLSETTLDKITIQDIVDRAQVSRQTFYYHFGDVYELLEWSFQKILEQLRELPAADCCERALMVIEHMRTHRTLVMNVYRSLGVEHLSRGLEQIIRPLAMETLQLCRKSYPMMEQNEEFAASFVTYGILGVLIQWLNSGMTDDIESVINDIYLVREIKRLKEEQ